MLELLHYILQITLEYALQNVTVSPDKLKYFVLLAILKLIIPNFSSSLKLKSLKLQPWLNIRKML